MASGPGPARPYTNGSVPARPSGASPEVLAYDGRVGETLAPAAVESEAWEPSGDRRRHDSNAGAEDGGALGPRVIVDTGSDGYAPHLRFSARSEVGRVVPLSGSLSHR